MLRAPQDLKGLDIFPGIEIEGHAFSFSSPDYLDTPSAVRYAADQGLYLVSAAASAVRRTVLYGSPDWDFSHGHQRLGTLFGFTPLSSTLVQIHVGGFYDMVGDDLEAHVSLASTLKICNALPMGDSRVLDFVGRSIKSGRSFCISSDAEEASSRLATAYLSSVTIGVPLATAEDHFLTRSIFRGSARRYCRFLASGACEELVFWFPLISALVERGNKDRIEFAAGALAGYDPRWKTSNVYGIEGFNFGGWACGVDNPDAFSGDGSKKID